MESTQPLRPLAAPVLTLSALLVAACSTPMNERQKDTATGAGIGAVAGAVIGSATGGKAGQSALIGGALGALGGNLWSKHMEDKRQALQQASAGTGVAVDRTADNQLRLNVPSDVSFDVGRADIKPQMRPVLDEIGRNLDPNVRVTIVGHTDSSGNDGINDPLSLDRAEAVRDYLADRGVRSTRMAVEGRGSHQPIASNTSESGRASNRRVEILLSEPSG
jgi:outer membrane protein OmpA-like peptidoglycan-associated protein